MFLFYALSPRIRRASWISLGMMVTRLAWIAHKFVSSKSLTRYASADSCKPSNAVALKRTSCLKSWEISLTSLWSGSFWINKSVLFWYLRISRSATVPGRYLWGFLTPPDDGDFFLAAFVASCLRGAFPPVDFRAVCLVLAIVVWILSFWCCCCCCCCCCFVLFCCCCLLFLFRFFWWLVLFRIPDFQRVSQLSHTQLVEIVI